jgi:hypothetical protein
MNIIIIFIIFLFYSLPSPSDEIEFSEPPTVTTLNIHESKVPVKRAVKSTTKKKSKAAKRGKKRNYKKRSGKTKKKYNSKRKTHKSPYSKRVK